MEYKFKVGDRVRIVSARDDNDGAHRDQIGMEAEVTKVKFDCLDYQVKFDRDTPHAFKSYSYATGYVYRGVYEDEIELVSRPAGRQRIVIEYDGKVTTAKMLEGKSVVRTARCIRADGDEHDMAFAMRLLCDRLFPESVKHDEPVKPEEEYQMFTGRAVCIRGAGEGLQEGRIYDFVNGETVDEQGNKRPAVVLSRPEHIAWFFTLFLPLKPDAEKKADGEAAEQARGKKDEDGCYPAKDYPPEAKHRLLGGWRYSELVEAEDENGCWHKAYFYVNTKDKKTSWANTDSVYLHGVWRWKPIQKGEQDG